MDSPNTQVHDHAVVQAEVNEQVDENYEQVDRAAENIRNSAKNFVKRTNRAFRNDSQAQERFKRWAETSELTRSGNGRFTYVQLGEVLGCTSKAAKKYYTDPSRLSNEAMANLMRALGTRGCYELFGGHDAFNRALEKEEKDLLVRRADKLLESVDLDTAKILVAALEGAVKELARRRGNT